MALTPQRIQELQRYSSGGATTQPVVNKSIPAPSAVNSGMRQIEADDSNLTRGIKTLAQNTIKLPMSLTSQTYKIAGSFANSFLGPNSKITNYLNEGAKNIDYLANGQDNANQYEFIKQLDKRGQNIKDIRAEGNVGVRKNLPVAGQIAGGIGDVVGAGVMSGLKAVTPKFIEDKVSSGVKKVAGTQYVQDVASGYQNVKAKYPETVRAVESVANIGSLLMPSGAKKIAEEGGGAVLRTAGQGLVTSAEKGIQKNTIDFAKELVSPIRTKAVKEAEVARTQMVGGKKIVTATPWEQQAIDEVAKIKGISPKNTLQKNYNIISDENINLAKKLESDIASTNIIIPKKETISRLNKVLDTLAESPVIVGDAEKTATKLLDGAKKFVNESGGSLKGILKARKDYDNWVKTQKPKAFDATSENAFTIANREVRDTLNNLLIEKAPNVETADLLKRQTALYNAMENITPKAAGEAATSLGRAAQKIGDTLGTRNKIVQSLVGIGLLGGGASVAAFSLPLFLGAGAAFITYKGGKVILSSEARKLLGELLKEAGTKASPEDVKVIKDFLKKDAPLLKSSTPKSLSPLSGEKLPVNKSYSDILPPKTNKSSSKSSLLKNK